MTQVPMFIKCSISMIGTMHLFDVYVSDIRIYEYTNIRICESTNTAQIPRSPIYNSRTLRHLHNLPTNPPRPTSQSTSPASPRSVEEARSRSSTNISTTLLELPTHPSSNGIPGWAYDPTMYTDPFPGFRAGSVRWGVGSGNALVSQRHSLLPLPPLSASSISQDLSTFSAYFVATDCDAEKV